MDLQALVMIVAGLVWGGVSVRVLSEERRLGRDGVPVEATVTGRSRRSYEGGTIHRLHTTYQGQDDASYRRKVSVCRSDYEAVATGDTVTLLVHPARPRRSRLAPGSLPATDREVAARWLRQEGLPQRVTNRAVAFLTWVPPVTLTVGGLLALLGLID